METTQKTITDILSMQEIHAEFTKYLAPFRTPYGTFDMAKVRRSMGMRDESYDQIPKELLDNYPIFDGPPVPMMVPFNLPRLKVDRALHMPSVLRFLKKVGGCSRLLLGAAIVVYIKKTGKFYRMDGQHRGAILALVSDNPYILALVFVVETEELAYVRYEQMNNLRKNFSNEEKLLASYEGLDEEAVNEVELLERCHLYVSPEGLEDDFRLGLFDGARIRINTFRETMSACYGTKPNYRGEFVPAEKREEVFIACTRMAAEIYKQTYKTRDYSIPFPGYPFRGMAFFVYFYDMYKENRLDCYQAFVKYMEFTKATKRIEYFGAPKMRIHNHFDPSIALFILRGFREWLNGGNIDSAKSLLGKFPIQVLEGYIGKLGDTRDASPAS